jgi:micrococcal nuclease
MPKLRVPRLRPLKLRSLAATAAVSIAAASLAAGCTLLTATPPIHGSRPPVPSPAPTPAPSEAPLELPADAQSYVVEYVFDGDTVRLVDSAGDEPRVRLIGVDAPEMSDPVECYAPQATERLRSLLPQGSTVRAAFDKDHYDRYGRTLLYVWSADGVFVNFDLVVNGYGPALSIWPNTLHKAAFDRAEAQARNTGLGLWAACPG